MKTTLLIIAFISVSIITCGQDFEFKKHRIDYGVGVGNVSFLSGVGLTMDIEYTYMLNPYIGIAPRLKMSNFRNYYEYIPGHLHVIQLKTFDLSFIYSPFVKKHNRLSIGIGLSLRDILYLQTRSYYTTSKDQQGIIEVGALGIPFLEDFGGIGLTGVINYKIIERENYCVGLKGTIQALYWNDDFYKFASVYIGFKL